MNRYFEYGAEQMLTTKRSTYQFFYEESFSEYLSEGITEVTRVYLRSDGKTRITRVHWESDRG